MYIFKIKLVVYFTLLCTTVTILNLLCIVFVSINNLFKITILHVGRVEMAYKILNMETRAFNGQKLYGRSNSIRKGVDT